MLRITVQEEANSIVMVLEGRLAGDWVSELRSVWTDLQTHQKPLVVTLTEMTSLDCAGQALLIDIHANGGVLRGSGLKAHDVIETITGKRKGDRQ
jgi:hypothetical protein